MRTSGPSIAELRAATQPPSIFERNSGEHWAGRLYIRRASPYLTRTLLPTPLTPNAVTWLMLLSGLAAAGLLTLPGLGWAIAGCVTAIREASATHDVMTREAARTLCSDGRFTVSSGLQR